MIAVSEQSGDTVNILTRLDHEFEVEDAYKTFIFLSGEHSVSSLLLSGPNEPGKHKEIKADQKEIHKVARDPDFDELADNDHPTIIGFVGERIDELPKELKE